MKGKMRFLQLISWLALMQPLFAEAHPLHWATESIGFIGGLIHPLISVEHVLTMLVVGLWIARGKKKAVYFMPVIFATLMLTGGSLALISVEIPHSELVMSLSVLILGVILAAGIKASSAVAVVAVVNVAVLYGYTHAYDMLLDVDAIAYTFGFALATVALIAIGTTLKILFNRVEFRKPGKRLIKPSV